MACAVDPSFGIEVLFLKRCKVGGTAHLDYFNVYSANKGIVSSYTENATISSEKLVLTVSRT